MAKYIKVSDEMKASQRDSFMEYISSVYNTFSEAVEDFKKSFDKDLSGKTDKGKVELKKNIALEYSKDLGSVDRTALLTISTKAFIKMQGLVSTSNKEVAWHGTARRGDEGDADTYYIDDILVYPQQVTGITVDRDRKKYFDWLQSIDDDTFSHLRMQGHSHVNMGTTPSGTDLEHQREMLDQCGDEDFYIFLIMNKSMDMTVKIYDLQKNILFEDSDIAVDVEGVDIYDFLDDAKSKVEEKTYTSNKEGKKSKRDKADIDIFRDDDFFSDYHGYNGYQWYSDLYGGVRG